MYQDLEKINTRPAPFEFYTAEELWTDDHTSQQMLQYHLNESIDVSSRNIAFINRSVEWIAEYFKINKETRTIDFGCGPGLYTIRLAKKGANVTGIDFSKRSIEYARNAARERGLEINYVHQNYLTFESNEKFDLITMIMCDFCALSPQQRSKLLQKFHKLLKPNGSVLLDVYTLEAFAQREEQSLYEINSQNGFWSPEKYYGFQNTFKYEQEKVILDKYTIIRKNRTRVVYNWLQYFSQEMLRSEVESSGFKIEKFYGDVAGAEFDSKNEEMAIVFRMK